MSTETLIRQGLARFVSGDFSGAAACWLRARELDPSDRQLQTYLSHLGRVAPGLIDAPAAPMAAELTPEALDSDPPAAADARAGANDPGASALGLLARSAPRAVPRLTADALARAHERLKERLDLDDFSGALQVAEFVLASEADDAAAAQAQRVCRDSLETMYLGKLSSRTAVPRLMLSPDQLIWQDLDERAGFVLAQVDGAASVEEIVDVTGMDRIETLRILTHLLEAGIIAVRS